jgi:signal transduction histidine kinase
MMPLQIAPELAPSSAERLLADERRRVSRELHDRVAHAILVVFRNLELLELYEERDPARARAKHDAAKAAARHALEATRDLCRELRRPLAATGLREALADDLGAVAAPEVQASVSVRGDESRLAPPVRDELFLILREAVRNAASHSGARRIAVELAVGGEAVTAVVEDDGRGLEQAQARARRAGGTGLASMAERASLLGGTVGLRSSPGSGTRVEVAIPLPRRAA